MRLLGVKIGFALTGSHCCMDDVMPQVRKLVNEGAEVYPVMSGAVFTTDTRFGDSQKWRDKINKITGRDIVSTITGAEPIGPQKLHDIIVVAPCTGNTLAKLSNGITDTPVLMAVKAQLRNQRPVVLAVSTNDGLSMNAKNIGALLNMKNIFLVPFGQDNPIGKPNSLVAKWDLMVDTIQEALIGKQYQPLLVIPS